MIDYRSQAGSVDMPKRLSSRRIADDITARIKRGEFGPGDQLPSYRDLAASYDVSVATIARAIALLRYTNVVEGEPGRGTFVPEDG